MRKMVAIMLMSLTTACSTSGFNIGDTHIKTGRYVRHPSNLSQTLGSIHHCTRQQYGEDVASDLMDVNLILHAPGELAPEGTNPFYWEKYRSAYKPVKGMGDDPEIHLEIEPQTGVANSRLYRQIVHRLMDLIIDEPSTYADGFEEALARLSICVREDLLQYAGSDLTYEVPGQKEEPVKKEMVPEPSTPEGVMHMGNIKLTPSDRKFKCEPGFISVDGIKCAPKGRTPAIPR